MTTIRTTIRLPLLGGDCGAAGRRGGCLRRRPDAHAHADGRPYRDADADADGRAAGGPRCSSVWTTCTPRREKRARCASAAIPSDFRRDAWLVFEERYPGINVEYVALAGGEANSRLQSEWENGVWEWDILATGATYLLGSYATENHLLDLHDVIFDPEVLDDSQWLGGGFDANFLDAAGRYMFAFHVFIAETAFVRDDLAPVDSFDLPRRTCSTLSTRGRSAGLTRDWAALRSSWRRSCCNRRASSSCATC